MQHCRYSQRAVRCRVATAYSQGRQTATATSGLAVTEVTSSTLSARARRGPVSQLISATDDLFINAYQQYVGGICSYLNYTSATG